MRNINDAGLNLIKEHEGCRLTSYPDPGTGGAPWTIGYGHTGVDVHPDMTITQDAADAILLSDLNRFELGVSGLVHVDINDNQFAALVSLAFNMGLGKFASSTVLKYVNESDFNSAAEHFLHYNHADGRVMAGLTNHRESERDLFLS